MHIGTWAHSSLLYNALHILVPRSPCCFIKPPRGKLVCVAVRRYAPLIAYSDCLHWETYICTHVPLTCVQLTTPIQVLGRLYAAPQGLPGTNIHQHWWLPWEGMHPVSTSPKNKHFRVYISEYDEAVLPILNTHSCARKKIQYSHMIGYLKWKQLPLAPTFICKGNFFFAKWTASALLVNQPQSNIITWYLWMKLSNSDWRLHLPRNYFQYFWYIKQDL